jgi:hypothetical protein
MSTDEDENLDWLIARYITPQDLRVMRQAKKRAPRRSTR